MSTDYRTIEDKVQNIERYLIRQIDTIRRWVIAAFALCAVGTLTSVWIALRPSGANDGQTAQTAELVPAASPSRATASPATSLVPTEGLEDAAPAVPAEPSLEVAEQNAPAPAKGSASSVPAASTWSAPSAPAPATRSAPAAPAHGGFQVSASAIATRITGLQPFGVASRFPASVHKLYCWARVTNDDLSATPPKARHVTIRWMHEGKNVRERRVDIASSSYRVYTSIEPGGRTGAWRAEIVDASGEVVGTERFVIE